MLPALPALFALALALASGAVSARPPEPDPRFTPPGRDRGGEMAARPPGRDRDRDRGDQPPPRTRWETPPAESRGYPSGRAYSSRPPARQQSGDVGPDQAARAAGRASGGRVLGIGGEAPEYRVKVITEGGRVRVLRIDARTGEVVE